MAERQASAADPSEIGRRPFDLLRVSGQFAFHDSGTTPAHYLLQDRYVALVSGKKPLIESAHGSDSRKLNHCLSYMVVKHVRENCKILFNAPSISGTEKRFREDADCFFSPVNSEHFPRKSPNRHDYALTGEQK